MILIREPTQQGLHKLNPITQKPKSTLNQYLWNAAKDPEIDEKKLFLMIISARNNFEERETIRNSWLHGHKNYKFVIGNTYCKIPNHQRESLDKEAGHHCNNCNCNVRPDLPDGEEVVLMDDPIEEHINRELILENKLYNDLALVPMIDTYQNLTLKVKHGIKTIVEIIDSQPLSKRPQWILKIDDDSVVIPKLVEKYLTTYFPYEKLLYAGAMVSDSPILRSGAFGETHYNSLHDPRNVYPPYASGASGYVLTYDLANYIRNNFNELYNYICEDTAIGIWLEKARDDDIFPGMKFVYVSNYKIFSNEEFKSCYKLADRDNHFVTLGHKMNSQKIIECYDYFKESARYQEIL